MSLFTFKTNYSYALPAENFRSISCINCNIQEKYNFKPDSMIHVMCPPLISICFYLKTFVKYVHYYGWPDKGTDRCECTYTRRQTCIQNNWYCQVQPCLIPRYQSLMLTPGIHLISAWTLFISPKTTRKKTVQKRQYMNITNAINGFSFT